MECQAVLVHDCTQQAVEHEALGASGDFSEGDLVRFDFATHVLAHRVHDKALIKGAVVGLVGFQLFSEQAIGLAMLELFLKLVLLVEEEGELVLLVMFGLGWEGTGVTRDGVPKLLIFD